MIYWFIKCFVPVGSSWKCLTLLPPMMPQSVFLLLPWDMLPQLLPPPLEWSQHTRGTHGTVKSPRLCSLTRQTWANGCWQADYPQTTKTTSHERPLRRPLGDSSAKPHQNKKQNTCTMYNWLMGANVSSDPYFLVMAADVAQCLHLDIGSNNITCPEIVQDFSTYYMQDLCSPKSSELFDEVTSIEQLCRMSDGGHSSVSTEEVRKTITLLKSKVWNSVGVNTEHPYKVMLVILASLAVLFNVSLATAYVTWTFRRRNITPIWKEGKPHEMMDSYRDITVSSIFTEALERVVLTRPSGTFQLNDLQVGLTWRKTSQFSALLLIDAIAETPIPIGISRLGSRYRSTLHEIPYLHWWPD